MFTISKLVSAFLLIIAAAMCYAGDNYGYGGAPYYGGYPQNDWRSVPQGRNDSPMTWNSENIPWNKGFTPWGDDNPMWDRGTDFWRDWDTNKWGGNGMPWGGDGFWSGNKMPWSKDNKVNRGYNNPPPYSRPYGPGYGYPYPGGYGRYPYNPAQVPPSGR